MVSSTAKIEYQIVHQTPERVRLRIPLLRDNLEYGNALQAMVEAMPAIASVRLNPAASSLIVYYQTGAISASDLHIQLAICIQNAGGTPDATDQEDVPSTLVQAELATRLGVKSQTITYWRSKAEFGSWSRDRDPAAIAWSYQSDAKLFVPIKPVSSS